MQIKFDDSFNWLAVLKDLAGGMEIEKEDSSQLTAMSMRWPTCACGQLCKDIAREDVTLAPIDRSLQYLGGEFMWYIAASNWRAAIKTFHKIEERTTELLEHANPRQD